MDAAPQAGDRGLGAGRGSNSSLAAARILAAAAEASGPTARADDVVESVGGTIPGPSTGAWSAQRPEVSLYRRGRGDDRSGARRTTGEVNAHVGRPGTDDGPGTGRAGPRATLERNDQ